MCGLTGVLIGGSPGSETRRRIADVFTASLLANEERGREATGVASLDRTGSVRIEKLPLRATEFVERAVYQSFIEEAGNAETVILLGHTRRPTKGSTADHHNNHPISVGNTVGIHNGTITNDDEIFLSMDRRKDRRRKRIGSVDSEAIFALMEDVDLKKPQECWAKGFQEAAALLVGSYTTLFFNRTLPHLLFLLKFNNPISVHYSPDLNALFFSSRYVFLRKAFGKSVITEALASKTGYVFDARSLETRRKQPCMKFGLHQLKTELPFWGPSRDSAVTYS
jgi:glucosamine 6-phosphate synthetase-like amidotransferase/phosphosugar isomerase protein